MKMYEFGTENTRTLLMLQCAVEPWYVFKPAAQALAGRFHIYLAAPDGHDPCEQRDFVSIEKSAEETAGWLCAHGITHLDAAYGACMGGTTLMRLLATADITVDRVILDAAVAPSPYRHWVNRVISVRDFVGIWLVTRSLTIMKLALPPERWTIEGHDADAEYRELVDFFRKHYSARTIYNTFWSTNNYEMPDPVRRIPSRIEYWYGSKEKKERAADIAHAVAYVRTAFPQVVFRELEGYSHLEMVLCHPEAFGREALRFLDGAAPEREETAAAGEPAGEEIPGACRLRIPQESSL